MGARRVGGGGVNISGEFPVPAMFSEETERTDTQPQHVDWETVQTVFKSSTKFLKHPTMQ